MGAALKGFPQNSDSTARTRLSDSHHKNSTGFSDRRREEPCSSLDSSTLVVPFNLLKIPSCHSPSHFLCRRRQVTSFWSSLPYVSVRDPLNHHFHLRILPCATCCAAKRLAEPGRTHSMRPLLHGGARRRIRDFDQRIDQMVHPGATWPSRPGAHGVVCVTRCATLPGHSSCSPHAVDI